MRDRLAGQVSGSMLKEHELVDSEQGTNSEAVVCTGIRLGRGGRSRRTVTNEATLRRGLCHFSQLPFWKFATRSLLPSQPFGSFTDIPLPTALLGLGAELHRSGRPIVSDLDGGVRSHRHLTHLGGWGFNLSPSWYQGQPIHSLIRMFLRKKGHQTARGGG